MKPEKAYIIRISDPLSQQYAQDAAESCKRIGLQYEFFDGIESLRCYDAWTATGLDIRPGSMDHRKDTQGIDKAACCSVSHALVRKRIAETQQCAVILEYDAVMLHSVDIDIPDDRIVVLGYKLIDPNAYDHKAAGPPRKVYDIEHHRGAHAYALTPNTAQKMLNELRMYGGGGPIDNRFFMKNRRGKVPLSIVDPIAALGWIRKSTIWDEACTSYGSPIGSFFKHLKQ